MLSTITQVLSVGAWGLILTAVTILGSFITTVVLIIRAHQKDLDDKLGKAEFKEHKSDHDKVHDELAQRLSTKVNIAIFEQEREISRSIMASIKHEVDEYKRMTIEMISATSRIEEKIDMIQDMLNEKKRGKNY